MIDIEKKSGFFTLPNFITGVRILSLPLIFLFITEGEMLKSFILTASAALSDWLDGYLARKTGSVSRIGEVIDPFADRLMVLTITFALAKVRVLPLWVFYGFLIREMFAIISYVYFLRRGIQIKVIREGKIVATILYVVLILAIAYKPAAYLVSLVLFVYIGLLIGYAYKIIYR